MRYVASKITCCQAISSNCRRTSKLAEPDPSNIPPDCFLMENPTVQPLRVMVDLSQLPTGAVPTVLDQDSDDNASLHNYVRELFLESRRPLQSKTPNLPQVISTRLQLNQLLLIVIWPQLVTKCNTHNKPTLRFHSRKPPKIISWRQVLEMARQRPLEPGDASRTRRSIFLRRVKFTFS